MAAKETPGGWVLLSYRLPREPSTPRIAVWRKLDRLGVARLGDGLVGLPADNRTREQVAWIAQEILEAGGTATVWLAAPADSTQEQAIAASLQQARVAEYEAIIEQARAASGGGAEPTSRVLRRLRAELRRTMRRDFFPPPQRAQAQAAVEALAEALASPPVAADPARPR